ncbi:MAG: 3-isopropylmalate dehydratase small subunit [Cellvibrionales bacterium TMED148]|nr:3-isopropylmalate dehydratase small subunit [Porticoccaceae bacterium]RPG90036.1 MAG: 3-isopropylmalate dehydratase small subunit [Cellvibrionales bacterium TMED148]
MRAFSKHNGLVGPMDRANVDTDMIIPKQFLKSIKRSGFGVNLFDELRYLDEGEPGKDCSTRPRNMNFALNESRYAGASILLARKNFGCGSSREHAPWALDDYGFRVIIAPSFADIFYNNCLKNGLLPVILSEEDVEHLFQELYITNGFHLSVDLVKSEVASDSGEIFKFYIDNFSRDYLIKGLDEIGLTLQSSENIKRYELERARQHPWIFGAIE